MKESGKTGWKRELERNEKHGEYHHSTRVKRRLYPSSATLLVLSVMPTLLFRINSRAKSQTVRQITAVFVLLFSAFMVIGRLPAGVHWLTDIVGAVLLSAGLYSSYQAAVLAMDH